jgi:hypothetical protein
MAGPFSASPDLNRPLQVGWIAASTILLLAILASSVQLDWRRRRWERGNMAAELDSNPFASFDTQHRRSGA